MATTQYTDKAAPARTVDYYLSVTGKNSGDIAGEVVRGKLGVGTIAVYEWSWECSGSRDLRTGMPSGKRQHSPLVCHVPLGKYSPLLAQALWTNEALTKVKLDFVRASDQGDNALFYTIELKNASLSQIRDSSAPDEGYPMQELSFTYENIKMLYVDGGVEAEDDWQGYHA